jgi:hypothetical protein
MKKLALILAFMMIPCVAFGLEMLTDNTMDTITGQDGVSIIADDIQLFLNVDLFAYADTDGYDLHNGCSATGCDNGALIAVTNFQLDVININAIIGSDSDGACDPIYNTNFTSNTINPHNIPLASTSCGIPLFYDYASTEPFATCISTCTLTRMGSTSRATKGLDNYTPQDFYFDGTMVAENIYVPQALSIDLTSKAPAITQAYAYILGQSNNTLLSGLCDQVGVMGVIITLPTMEIYIQDINFEVAMYDTACSTLVINGGQFATSQNATINRFGEFVLEGVTFSILSGWVEIVPH